MSNPDQARRVSAQIFFQGADITGSMRPYLLSATYTDKEEADDYLPPPFRRRQEPSE